MQIAIENLTPPEIYPLLVGGVLPRPIAWVSTQSADGIDNLAPYSFFTVASVNPPILAISHIAPRAQGEKDTLANLKATGDCVINVVTAEQAEAMNATCPTFEPNVSEFERAGIESVASEKVNSLGVKASPIRYECQLREILPLSDKPAGGSLILLDLLHIYVEDALYHEGKIKGKDLNLLGKLGGDSYSLTQPQIEMPRPNL